MCIDRVSKGFWDCLCICAIKCKCQHRNCQSLSCWILHHFKGNRYSRFFLYYESHFSYSFVVFSVIMVININLIKLLFGCLNLMTLRNFMNKSKMVDTVAFAGYSPPIFCRGSRDPTEFLLRIGIFHCILAVGVRSHSGITMGWGYGKAGL